MMLKTVREIGCPARYHNFSRRWVLPARQGSQKAIVLRSASFREFYKSAKQLSRIHLVNALHSLWRHTERNTDQFATLLLYFYLFIHLRGGWTGFRDLWTRPSWRRNWSFFSDLWTCRTRLRRRYREFVAELERVAEQTPPTIPPMTAWAICHQSPLTRESKRKHLAEVLNHYKTRPPGDESKVLGCWVAARELLYLALDDKSSMQVRQALGHYKRFISGPHAHLVGQGDLSTLVRQDLLHLCEKFPEYLELENKDKQFLENWFLARFSVNSALKVAFPRNFRIARYLLGAGGFLALAVVFGDLFGWYEPLARTFHEISGLKVPEIGRYILALMPFVTAVGLFVYWPQVFRLLYPRLFAGAVFGWTSVIAAIGSEVLFTQESERTHLSNAVMAMEITAPEFILFIVVGFLPMFFLYQEAFSAIGIKKAAGIRAILTFFFLLIIVGIVGLVFVMGVDLMLCGEAEASCPKLHWRLLLVGCVISTYFAVITQLVWVDQGISSTLARRGYVDKFEERYAG